MDRRVPRLRHPLVEDPPRGSLTRADKERQGRLLARARVVCEACPLRTPCLYDAVVRHDVAGFVAGTTAAVVAGLVALAFFVMQWLVLPARLLGRLQRRVDS